MLAPSRRRRRTPTSSAPWPTSFAELGQDADPAGRRRLVARGSGAFRLAGEAPLGSTVDDSLHAASRSGRDRRARSAAGPCSSRTASRSSARTRRSRRPALAARPAHGGRPARGRKDPPGRRRRTPAGLQRRHDELRARARDGAARRRVRLRPRRRRLDDDGVRRPAAEPPSDPGGERAVADARSSLYYGVYVPAAAAGALAERRRRRRGAERSAYKVVRPSTVTVDARRARGAPLTLPIDARAAAPTRRFTPEPVNWTPRRPLRSRAAGSSSSTATDDLGRDLDRRAAVLAQQDARVAQALTPHARRRAPQTADDRGASFTLARAAQIRRHGRDAQRASSSRRSRAAAGRAGRASHWNGARRRRPRVRRAYGLHVRRRTRRPVDLYAPFRVTARRRCQRSPRRRG